MPRNSKTDSIENHCKPTEYKKLEGFDYEYFITKDGRVWSNNRKNGIERFMKQYEMDGYLNVGLYKDGKQKKFRVHRLVAQAFITNLENKPYINHIDGDRKNNCVSNLEWCTQRENVIHAIHTLNKWSNTDSQRKIASKCCILKRKLTMDEAREVRHLHFDTGYTISELSNMYGLSETGIKRILYNKSYREEGTKWENMS